MNIELKNIILNEEQSTILYAFTADLYIDGVHAGNAVNDGSRQPIQCKAGSKKGQAIIDKAKNWCAQLPPIIHHNVVDNTGNPLKAEMNLPYLLFQLLNQHVKENEPDFYKRRTERLMESAILFALPGKDYSIYRFGKPIAVMFGSAANLQGLKSYLETIFFPWMHPDAKILNTNIPAESIRELGIEAKMIQQPEALSNTDNKLARRNSAGNNNSYSIKKSKRL